jgi:hypothetical protein
VRPCVTMYVCVRVPVCVCVCVFTFFFFFLASQVFVPPHKASLVLA